MDDLVSVIVPVYNVENYLVKCLDSLADQDYENYEVLLVNDGSTDKSLNICEEYENKYSFFKVINQKNAGVSVARNNGINLSRGKYITFVDSDDYVARDYISYLVGMLNGFNSKIAACAHQTVWPNSVGADTSVGTEELVSDKEYFRRLGLATLPAGVGIAVHDKIFAKELFDDITFRENQSFGEDSDIIYKLILKSKDLVIGSKLKYFYLKRPGSAVESKFNISRLDFVYSEEKLAEAVLEKYPDLQDEMIQRLTHVKMNTLAHMVLVKDSSLKGKEISLRNEILENYSLLSESDTVPKRDKIALKTIKLGLLPYKIMYRAFKYKQKNTNV